MIVLVVLMTVKPGTEEECRRLIATLEQHTRREPGCIQYKGLQAKTNPAQFVMYEEYKDEVALEAHRSSDYYKQFVNEGLDRIIVDRTRTLFRPVTGT